MSRRLTQLGRRKSSIPSYLICGGYALEVAEADHRWRRSSHAALSAMLPSRGAYHSDTGLTVAREITDPQRRKSMQLRRKSLAAVTEMTTTGEVDVSRRSSTMRQLLRRMSTVNQWQMREQEQQQLLQTVKSMTTSLSVKRRYRGDTPVNTNYHYGNGQHSFRPTSDGHNVMEMSERKNQRKQLATNKARSVDLGDAYHFPGNESRGQQYLYCGDEDQDYSDGYSPDTDSPREYGNHKMYRNGNHAAHPYREHANRESHNHGYSVGNPQREQRAHGISYYGKPSGRSEFEVEYDDNVRNSDSKGYKDSQRPLGAMHHSDSPKDQRNRKFGQQKTVHDYSLANDYGHKRNASDDIAPDYNNEDEASSDDEDMRRYSGFDALRQFADHANDDYYDDQNYQGERPSLHGTASAPLALETVKRHHGESPILHSTVSTTLNEVEVGDYKDDSPILHHHSSASVGLGVDNPGFTNDRDEDVDSLYQSRIRRASSVKGFRHVRNRHRSFNANHQDERISFADGMKTLMWKRKSMRRVNAREVEITSDPSPAAIYDNDDLYDYVGDAREDEEDVLPSNRIKRTVTLRERLENLQKSHKSTAHDMATLIRDEILVREPSDHKGLSQWKFQMTKNWVRFKNWLKNWIYQLELWAGTFKIIEGHFGTSTMAYFRFLRWLMFLNLFLVIFMLSLVVLPFVLISTKDQFMSTVDECQSEYHYRAVFYSTNYTDTMATSLKHESSGQYVLDVLQGTGLLENTELFYGVYHNKTSRLVPGNPYTYNMALAYLCAVGVAFVLSFILLVKNSAKGFKQGLLSGSSGNLTLYCNKVFGAWDYCISLEKTAQLKHKSILQDFMNELECQRLQWKKASRTTKERVKLFLIRLLIHLLVITILGGSLYLVYYTNQRLLDLKDASSGDEVLLLLIQYLPSITITVLNVIVPVVFNKVVTAEDYLPSFTIRITLIRTVALRLASLGVLMLSLYTMLEKRKSQEHIDSPCQNWSTPAVQTTSSPGTTLPPSQVDSQGVTNSSSSDSNQILCWETYVGQQIYKLIILNFLVVIAVTFLWEFPRKLIFTKFHERFKIIDLLGQQQFDLSKNILDLVYLQTLCWLGLFFSPFIPAMCLLSCFIFFYVKKVSLMYNCLPTQQYGTSKSNSLFMMVLLLAFVFAAIPIAFMIGRIQPSQGCGPFRVYSSGDYVMFDAVSDVVEGWHEAKSFFFFLGTGGFMAVAIFLICSLMYYYWIVGQAHQKMAKALKEQLKVEGQDKQFLLARVNEVLGWEEAQDSTSIASTDPEL